MLKEKVRYGHCDFFSSIGAVRVYQLIAPILELSIVFFSIFKNQKYVDFGPKMSGHCARRKEKVWPLCFFSLMGAVSVYQHIAPILELFIGFFYF